MHILEAGDKSAPLLVLLHGFPELSYSWRDVILPLAQLGFHVVAPDQRGYGRTQPLQDHAHAAIKFEDDLSPYSLLNLVHDIIALVFALGHTSVACVIGHDFGSSVAGFCALVRPDLFRSLILMSAPFPGAPPLPFAVESGPAATPQNRPAAVPAAVLDDALARLDPPRQYYMRYFCGPGANADMTASEEGLRAFLRAYFHVKSADWAGNASPLPHALPMPASVAGLARLPHYYVMPRGVDMPAAVGAHAPTAEEVARQSSRWLPDNVLEVYVQEFGRAGFQGGLNWYRTMLGEMDGKDWGLRMFSGKKVEVPAMFLAGKMDWGAFQSPGALEKMQREVCVNMKDEDVVFVEDAGHWVQQEQPEDVVRHIRRFLEKQTS